MKMGMLYMRMGGLNKKRVALSECVLSKAIVCLATASQASEMEYSDEYGLRKGFCSFSESVVSNPSSLGHISGGWITGM